MLLPEPRDQNITIVELPKTDIVFFYINGFGALVKQFWGSVYIQNCHIVNLNRYENTYLTENCLAGFQLIEVISVIRFNVLSRDGPLTGSSDLLDARKKAKCESI
jgi:hypothetical protein